MVKIGFIGAGNMGAALALGINKCPDAELYISDKDEKKALALAERLGAHSAKNGKIADECDFIFLAVKPNILPSVLFDILNELKKRKMPPVLVSMAAGVSVNSLEECLLAYQCPVIRIMPNTPSSVGEGMILWCKNELLSKKEEEIFLNITLGCGIVDKTDEGHIDAASAVSGCGPAFAFMFLESLADGGVRAGLSRDKATLYAAQMMKGAAEMVLSGMGHPEALKDAVCSPSGSTIEGVHALEEGGMRASVANAVYESYKKTLLLGKK